MCGRCCRFLIASAPLFFCHALCKSVVEQVADRGKAFSVPTLAVHAIVDGNEAHIVAGEDDVGVPAYSEIITTKAGWVFAQPAAYQSLLTSSKPSCTPGR